MAYQSILNPHPVTGPLTDVQLRASPVPISGTVTANISGTVPVSGPLTDAQARASALPVSLSALPSLATGGNVIGAVSQSGAWSVSISGTAAVSGTVTANLGTIAGVATETTLAALNTKTPALGQATMAASTPVVLASNQSALAVSGPLTDTQIRATALPVSGTVTANAGTGTFAVSGPLTDAQLRATAVPTSATQSGTWNIGSITTLPALATGANVIGALTANQSVNNAQIGGVAVAVGSGVTGTGVQRVVLATDVALPTGANSIGAVTVADVTATGTLTAAAQTVVISVANGMNTVAAQITGAWTGTITFEGTVDGTNYVPINGVFAGTSTPGSTITANGVVRITPGGLTSIRLIATAMSGTATITMRAGRGSGGTFLNQSLTAGTNIVGKFGIDQTTPGTTNLVALAPPAATYSASIVGLASAVTATDIFTITGSATKTVRVSRILVNGVQTTAAQVNILVVKRSTANTAGTSTAPTRVPYDSTNAAATATVLAYTANPTLGTTVGTVGASRLFIPGAATASDAQGLEIVAGDVGQQMMTARGIAEVIAVNLGGVTVTGGSLNVTVEWTES